MTHRDSKTGRRQFLAKSLAVAAAASTTQPSFSRAGSPLPTIRLGPYSVTRLVAGGNPVGGFAHTTLSLSRHMLDYFTVERTAEFLENCEREGINTWQFDHMPKPVEALRKVRERGSKLQFICLHAERERDAPLKTVISDMNPIAFVHHGGVTDRLFREGKAQQVRDFVHKAHDAGVLAGVSSHCPDNIRRMADEGWENDLFMTCFYYVTRSREEQEKLMGRVIVGEPFLESDPMEMTDVVRKVPKPCLGFKILAAGRLCNSQKSVEAAFKFAFSRIKASDAVIVGMYPRFEDEVRMNAEYVRRHGSSST